MIILFKYSINDLIGNERLHFHSCHFFHLSVNKLLNFWVNLDINIMKIIFCSSVISFKHLQSFFSLEVNLWEVEHSLQELKIFSAHCPLLQLSLTVVIYQMSSHASVFLCLIQAPQWTSIRKYFTIRAFLEIIGYVKFLNVTFQFVLPVKRDKTKIAS